MLYKWRVAGAELRVVYRVTDLQHRAPCVNQLVVDEEFGARAACINVHKRSVPPINTQSTRVLDSKIPTALRITRAAPEPAWVAPAASCVHVGMRAAYSLSFVYRELRERKEMDCRLTRRAIC